MVKTQLAIATLALLVMSTHTQAACATTNALSGLGFTAVTSNVVNNGTCKNYFSVGACVTPWSLINTLNVNNAWLQAQAVNAQNYAQQFVNATVYFGIQAGWLNANTNIPSNSDSSFWNSIGNFFKSLWNKATALFQTFVGWVKTLFNKTGTAINPCFQAWANLTNGAYCVATSNNNDTSSLTTSLVVNTLTLTVDPTSTGNALQACLPLIDNYCSLTFGVSTSNSASPFNTTFNWADGGLSVTDCQNIRSTANCTTAACTTSLNGYLTGLFATNWVRFVPSAISITYLGTFLAANATATTYVPVIQAPTGTGMNFAPAAQFGENVYADGLLSGQAGMTYGSAFSMIASIMIPLFALLI